MHELWMKEALVEARKAFVQGEVPVGAVLVSGGEVIARAHNEVEGRQDASAHAEVLAMQRASAALGSWRLKDATLYVTLEPCTMCIGGMILARMPELVFGCYDPRQGAVGSLFDLSQHPGLPHAVDVIPEVLAGECEAVLKEFFALRRTLVRPSSMQGENMYRERLS